MQESREQCYSRSVMTAVHCVMTKLCIVPHPVCARITTASSGLQLVAHGDGTRAGLTAVALVWRAETGLRVVWEVSIVLWLLLSKGQQEQKTIEQMKMYMLKTKRLLMVRDPFQRVLTVDDSWRVTTENART